MPKDGCDSVTPIAVVDAVVHLAADQYVMPTDLDGGAGYERAVRVEDHDAAGDTGNFAECPGTVGQKLNGHPLADWDTGDGPHLDRRIGGGHATATQSLGQPAPRTAGVPCGLAR